MADALRLSGIVRPDGRSRKRSVTGFRIEASLTRLFKPDPASPDIVPIPVAGGGVVDADGAFAFDIGGDGAPSAPVVVTVATPDGRQVLRENFTLDDVARPLSLRVEGIEPFEIAPTDNPTRGSRIILTGRVIDERGITVPAALPVVIWGRPATAADDAEPQPLVMTSTQAGGYFSGDWVSTTLKNAFGRVAGAGPLPIPLESDRLPRKVLLVLTIPESEQPPDAHGVGKPPAVPNPLDLTTNPAAFSQDLGRGCLNLSTPNRAIEEFTYSFVVRTSEPEVKGLTVGERLTVDRKAMAGLVEASIARDVAYGFKVQADHLEDLDALSLDVHAARRLVDGDHPPTLMEIKRAAWLSDVTWAKDLVGFHLFSSPVRQPLDADHPIDWDDTPTIYQAITIARGHILDFREVWRADGYSLGDLLQSLPLAPGQRRQIAVVDWERRTTTTREDALEFEEELNAFVGRDRDVSEIVGSRLAQEQSAASKNTTWGASGGIGAGFIGTGFGIFGGVAGSSGGSTSSAWQDSSRQFAGDSLQSLRDRVMQRASSVRDERSTVVQTAAQGETFRAVTETVANYNHCHAMTVEYFEVLRHFVISHELVDVRECLFVPFPMQEFDAGKALRWQTPLCGLLRDRELLPGFDAMRRVADNWVGWDYPLNRYSEEAPEILEGELRISFILPRPRDAADGAFQVNTWEPYHPYLLEDPYELWTRQIQRAMADWSAEIVAQRDREFREKVAPLIAKRIVDRLRFWYVTTAGDEVQVPLDPTLVSRYAEGVGLYVTLRPSGTPPAIPREQIAQFKITLETPTIAGVPMDVIPLPDDAQVIVQSGRLRYQTEHKRWLLFDNPRILNDLADNDAVYISTPTSWSETRNPRQEDRDLEARVLAHLNMNLEFYHQAIWTWLDSERRFLLLDGILVPGLGGKSVASVVENRLIGIAGNSLIMPLAPGIRIDPRVNTESEGDLIDLYAVDSPPPVRVSVPTRGVYAEAIMGHCNSCEPIDDSRYWRWTTAGMLEPPSIQNVGTGTRAEAETALTATPLPKPLVSIQNAPDLPAPVGLADVFRLLSRPDLFTDITGLEGTQKNARAAFDAALSAASGIAGEATKIARQQISSTNGERILDRINKAQADGLLTPAAAQELSGKVLGTMVGAPDEKTDKKAASPVSDPVVQKAVDKAVQSDKGSVKVSTADETIEMSFEGGDTKMGSSTIAPAVGMMDIGGDLRFTNLRLIWEGWAGAPGARSMRTTEFDLLQQLTLAFPTQTAAAVAGGFIRPNPADPLKFQFARRLRIVYPSDAATGTEVFGDRLPLVVMAHANTNTSWTPTEKRTHEGFLYLQHHLAKLGIVSVSVDCNGANFFNLASETRADLVLNAIDFMKEQHASPTSPFFERLDFDNVGLMGHSRGGEAVVRAALKNSGTGRCAIKAVASIAPPDFTGSFLPAERRALDEVSGGFYFVLYGGLDGDVTGFGGARGFSGSPFRLYDRATAPKAMAYVPGCVHSFFNTELSIDEENALLPADQAHAHSAQDHRQLAIEYIGSLFDWKLLGNATVAPLFNGRAANTLGHAVSLQWSWGQQRAVLDDFEDPAAATVGTRTVTSANTDIAEFADVVVNGVDLAEHTGHQTSILAIKAGVPGPLPAAYVLDLPATHKDWSGYDMLTFGLGTWMDVTSAATIAAGTSPPPISISITDGGGRTATIPHTKFTSPAVPGRPLFHQADFGTIKNVTLHRLATCAIPITQFAGVTLTDIRKLQVHPPASFPQRVFLDALTLVKL